MYFVYLINIVYFRVLKYTIHEIFVYHSTNQQCLALIVSTFVTCSTEAAQITGHKGWDSEMCSVWVTVCHMKNSDSLLVYSRKHWQNESAGTCALIDPRVLVGLHVRVQRMNCFVCRAARALRSYIRIAYTCRKSTPRRVAATRSWRCPLRTIQCEWIDCATTDSRNSHASGCTAPFNRGSTHRRQEERGPQVQSRYKARIERDATQTPTRTHL